MAVRKWEVVVLALADAGGLLGVVDTEDVAVAAHRLAPVAFSWRKYPAQIDLDSVRVSLTDACKEKYGGLVAGSVGEGWYVTNSGTTWLESAGRRARAALETSSPEKRLDARAESAHSGREVARVRASRAYKIWIETRRVEPRDAAAVFRIDRYTSERDRTLKTRRVAEAVNAASDKALSEFVRLAASKALEIPAIPELDISQEDTGE